MVVVVVMIEAEVKVIPEPGGGVDGDVDVLTWYLLEMAWYV